MHLEMNKTSCPLCEFPINEGIKLKNENKLLENMLNKLHIRCRNVENGCEAIVQLENLEKHELN